MEWAGEMKAVVDSESPRGALFSLAPWTQAEH